MTSNSFWRVCVFCANIFLVNGFNIDAFNYAVYGTQEASMFGFTVAVHKDGYNRGWVLVGAPEAQSHFQAASVRTGGVVYKCRPEGDDSCQEIPFDREGNQYFGSREMDQKSNQWFGAALSTSGNISGGPVVACAPRYVWYSKEMNRRDPVGTCFVSDSLFEKFEEYSPCRTSNWGYHRQGSCQAGFSAAINSIGDRLFVGAPGSYYWQGSVHQQSLETRPAVFQTREGRQQDDDSYMGYSTIVGDFLGTGEQGIVVGMPRGAELHGKVLLFTWNLTNYKNISSNQLGSYFGYSLAAADVDGDDKLDLIVGAPMHTEPNTEDKYDVGRVYIFYQGGGYGSFNKSSFIDGINSKSRFGHSVAFLGDMNKDGCQDFAVGAPYDGPFNRGAVYIYYGSPKGVLEKYGQVIYAEDVATRSSIPVNTFGFSITGGLDMDGNEYPDMAVGAYLANAAFFFRSRPVVRVEAFVKFLTKNKQIDIKKKNCDLPNGQRGTCTTIEFCIKYNGEGIPQQIRLNVQYILDTKKPNIPRMAFLRRNGHTLNHTITLNKGSQDNCQPEEIYIKNDIRDKLTPLEAEVKYFMIQEDRDTSYNRVRNPQSQLKPVLDLNLPPSRKDSLIIQKDCGNDNICIPNLHLNVTKNVEKYLLDSSTNLEFDIIVYNFGEDSFETTLDLVYPEGVFFVRTDLKEDKQGILCSPRENNTISCDIGNPLQANKIAKFRMIFAPSPHKQGMAPSYEFDIFVNSSNPETKQTMEDNYRHITVDIWVDSALDVSGRSIPQEIYLTNTTQYTSENIYRESEIGPQVTHLYTLRNKGPATIYEAEMYFLWPWQTLAGEDLLYLLEQPHVPEGVTCEIPAPANYRNYSLDYNPKPIWERLQIDSSSHDMTSKYSTVKVESGANITGVAGGSIGHTTKLDEEISVSSGDSSKVYERRHNFSTGTSGAQAVWESSGGSGMSSSGYISKPGDAVYTKSEWRTVIVDGRPIQKWTNVTTVKDASGKITTYYSTNDTGDLVTSGSNVDTFGQNIGGYTTQRSKPKIVYTSSGGGASSTGEENLSVSSRVGGTQGISREGIIHETKTSGVQESSGARSGYANERKFVEQKTYTVGGGLREGGVSTTASYDESQIISHSSQSRHHGVVSSGDTISETHQDREARMRYEERIRQEHMRHQEEERRRKMLEEQQRLAASNVVISQEEERQKRIKQQEEEQRRLYRQKQLLEDEIARQAYEDQMKRDEERRRQQIIDDQRRRQQQTPSIDSRREDEIRYRQEEEQRRLDEERWRQEVESRRQYDERRRMEEERRRQWNHEQTISGRQEGSRSRTGYFDSQGIYHDETGPSSTSTGGKGGVIFNHTWTAERTADIDDVDKAGGMQGQLDLGQIAGSDGNFRTQTIDLGMVGGLQGHGGASDLSRQQSSGQWHSSGQRTSGGTFSGTLEGGVSEHNRYDSEWERRRWEDTSVSPPPYVGRDDVVTDRPDPSRHRGRRQVPQIDPAIDEILRCTATRCFYVKCVVGTLKKDEFISIALRSRLNVRAVRQLSTTEPIKLSSMMVARISKLPYVGKPRDQVLHSHEIFTEIPAGEQELAPKVVPLWIILLSAIAGTVILLLVIFLLYKCGFFKRKRPSTAPERQPLRTNGYHPGD